MNEDDWGVLDEVEVELVSELEGGTITPVMLDVRQASAGGKISIALIVIINLRGHITS